MTIICEIVYIVLSDAAKPRGLTKITVFFELFAPPTPPYGSRPVCRDGNLDPKGGTTKTIKNFSQKVPPSTLKKIPKRYPPQTCKTFRGGVPGGI